MNWAVAITAAPRPIPTFRRTCQSIARAGWPDYTVCADDTGNAWRNWIGALKALIEKSSDAEALCVFQDDVVICRGARKYLERTLWPADDVALCSVFTPGAYRAERQGWNLVDRGWYLCAAQAWVLPPDAARAIVTDLGQLEVTCHIDAHVGKWAKETGRSVWYHTPSLAQHLGDRNSALGHKSNPGLRVAGDFVGENAEP